ncbi:DUF3566 domain-containing protein [Cellulomonas carbonis]|uniref:Membrane protein n=1 Tax=Cellulomonas carbonis T26 TaxID=947969 RepID=A0A0A0BWF0_9CELL|nr:DUF3566 domain-containing protein [Cellulomonas carbonis]KGM12275.1 membrane protein [Cellulomonas carbonis T26]GGC01270.1 membrane protein [Cellulomonas carbonis]
MSTDGTQPPSFAPRTAPARASVRTKEDDAPGTTAEQPTAVAARPAGSPSAEGPSMGDRLKRAAQGAVGTTTGRSEDAPARPAAGARPVRESTRVHDDEQEVAGPRRVRLAVAKIDPWSVMKLAFLLSFAIGIMIVVAAAVVWMTLDGLGVFTSVNDTIAEITGSPDFFNLLEYVSFSRILSLATLIAIVDVVLLTALSTIGAFLYNIVAALVGGIHLTLTDD